VAECFETGGYAGHPQFTAQQAGERIANSVNAVTRILGLLSGTEWDSETMGEVANILTEEGFTVREPDCYGGWDHDGAPEPAR
jgi:hypothetical protein